GYPIPASPSALVALAYDGENRLRSITESPNVRPYRYDAQGRRTTWSGNDEGTELRFAIYDGWNPIAEYRKLGIGMPFAWRAHTWGLDLSGSFQGVGGVGGLLAMQDLDYIWVGDSYLAYDGNGNVNDYLDDSGDVLA